MNAPGRSLRGSLFIFFAGLYLLGASGTVRDNADSVFLFGVALNLSRTGSFALPPDVEQILPPSDGYPHLRGRDGRLYFPKGMSYSALLAPFMAVGEGLGRRVSLGPEGGRLAMPMLLATTAGPLLAAAQCVVLFETALAFGFRRRTALLTALVAGLGTILWADSKANGLEPFHGLLISLAYCGVVKFMRSASAAWAAVVGASQAVLLLSQPVMMLLVVPVFAAYMTVIATRPDAAREVRWVRCTVAYGVPLMIGIILLALLNAARYGRFAATGYEWQAGRFEVPLPIGVYGLFFSAGKSLFLYSPPLALAIAKWRVFRQKVGPLGTLPLALLAAFVLIYGQFAYWSGDGAWGPRYLVPLTGPLTLMLAGALEPAAGMGISRLLRAGILSLTALGAAVQVAGVATSTWLYFKLLIDAGVLGPAPGNRAWAPILYEPEFSPVVGRARLLLSRVHRAWAGSSLTWDIPLPSGEVRTMDLFGYDEPALWPVLFTRPTAGTPRAVVAIIASLIVVVGLSAYRLRQALVRAPPP